MADEPQKIYGLRKKNLPLTTAVVPAEEAQAPDPSMLQRGLAAGTRVVSGFLGGIPAFFPGPGTAAGFGIGAGGEYLAEAIEEGFVPKSPGDLMKFLSDPKRAARATLEGSVTALPGGAFVKGGKALASAVRSGGIAMGGEAIREKLRGEDLSIPGLLLYGGVGGTVGGLLGKFTKPHISTRAGTKAPQTFDDLVTQHGSDLETFSKHLPQVMRK